MPESGASGEGSGTGSSPRTLTVADLVTLKLMVERGIGNPERKSQVLKHIDELEELLETDSTVDISSAVSAIKEEIAGQPRRYRALIVMLLVVSAGAALALVAHKKVDAGDTFLGYNLIFVLTAAGAGFTGSFVRVLNKIVTYAYFDMSTPTVALMMVLRPVAGAALGLFVAAVFAAGAVSASLGDPSDTIFAGITKGGAFIFAVAFIAGLVDEFALGVAERFTTMVRGTPSSPPQPTPKPTSDGG